MGNLKWGVGNFNHPGVYFICLIQSEIVQKKLEIAFLFVYSTLRKASP